MGEPDFDDIIFNKLNKEYGAYLLRKGYNKSVNLSIISAILIGCLAILIPELSDHESKMHEISTARLISIDRLTSPPGQPNKPHRVFAPDIPKAPPNLKISSAKYIAPKVVDTIAFDEKQILPTADSASTILEGQGDESGNFTSDEEESGVGDLFLEVEEMPKFKGGDISGFRDWVQIRTIYPAEATKNRIQGKVYITFIVEKDGSLSGGKVVEGVDSLLDEVALKSVMSSPKWTPGKQGGKTVRVSFIIMLNFRL